MSSDAPLYKAYLIRLWRDNPEQSWHVIVKRVGTEEQWQFTTMEALYLFLERHAHEEREARSEK